MKHLLSLVLASAAIVGSDGAPAAGPVSADASRGLEVTVSNGVANPVPVLPQGTTTIVGSVRAAQSGPWNVEVAGNADAPGRNPFQQSVSFSANDPNVCRAIPTSPQVWNTVPTLADLL